ncbi:MAG: hypothetical protein WC668_01760 [Patescibacteria group bacterium]|jgi:hypothetical protein
MKKFLTYSVVVATIAWSMGISAVLPAAAAYTPADGDLIKTASYSAVYYVTGGQKYLFVNRVTYTTWSNAVGDANNNFAGLKVISQSEFDALPLGGNITARAGVSLVKFDNSGIVYAVAPGSKLCKLVDSAAQTALYGSAAPIIIQSSFEANYTKDASCDLTATSKYPDGSLIKTSGDASVYYIEGGMKRLVSADGFTANSFKSSWVKTVSDVSGYTTGSALTIKEAAVSNVVSGASAPVVTLGTLGVSLSANNPVSATIVSDTVNTSQALVPMLAVNLTASSAGDVKVTGMQFTRTGISNDTDVSVSYLYEGSKKLAEGGSISSKVLTFNASNGIITVPAGQTKTVWLKIDTTIATGAGKSIGFNLTGVTSNATAISGTPLTGNLMSTASVTDLGYVVISSGNVPTAASTVNSNETDFEAYKVTLTATDQDMQLEGLRLTEIGSIGKDDLTNIKLVYGGTTLATAAFDDNMELYFDLSASPFQIAKGNSKTLSLRVDISKGSTRTFKFSIQYASDIVTKDLGYNVYTQAFKSGAVTWSAVTSAASTYVYTINSGTLTLAKDASSPSGTVAGNGTNVKLATYKITATGEDMKVKSMDLKVNTTSGQEGGLDNAKIYFDGVQVGSTKDLTTEATNVNFTFGSSFIVPAGTSKLVDIYADLKTSTGTAIVSGAATVTLSSSETQGVLSLTAGTLAAVDGSALTIGAVSTITLAEYTAYGDQTLPSPSSQAKMGSFSVAASASEGVVVENIYISGATSGELANMNLKVGSTIIGSKATFSATDASSTISISGGKLTLAKGETKVVDIYADITSGITNTTGITLGVNCDGTTPDTNTAATGAFKGLQTIVIGAGSLTLDTNGAKPDSAVIVAGATTAVSAFTMLAANDSFTINTLTVTSTVAASDRSVGAVILEYKNEAGETKTATGYLSSGSVIFNNLSIWIPKSVGATVTIKAMVADATGAKSGDIVRLNLSASDGTSTVFAATSKATGSAEYDYTGANGVTGNPMIVRKTKPTVSLISLPTSVLADGTQTISKFSIAADAAGDVTWRKMGFVYSTSAIAVDVTDLSIYLYKDGDSTKLNATGLSLSRTSAKTISFVADTEQTITKGTSQTYVLKADLTGTSAGTSFTTKISGTSATAGTSTTYALLLTETMFWWSDRSGAADDGVHTATSDDWCDSSYIKTLPTDSQTLSR